MKPLRPDRLTAPQAMPPLSQSRYEDLACETLYIRKHVQGVRVGDSQPAVRGTEVHQLLAAYIDHLVRTRSSSDLETFDTLMTQIGADAKEALERFRSDHVFDPEKIAATELYIALDDNFHPMERCDGRLPEYEGTLRPGVARLADRGRNRRLEKLLPDHRRGYVSIKVLSAVADVFQSVIGKGEIRTGVCALRSFSVCRIHKKGLAVAQGAGAEGTSTPKEAPRASRL